MLSESCQHVQHEFVGMWIVYGDELNATFHQVGNEGYVARQPVELGDDQPGFLFLASSKGGSKLWPVTFLPALYFSKFSDKLTVDGDVI